MPGAQGLADAHDTAVPELSLPGFSSGRVRQVSHRALGGRRRFRRYAWQDGASIPRAIMESLAGGTRVRGRRHFIAGAAITAPERGCLVNRSRDCTRSRVRRPRAPGAFAFFAPRSSGFHRTLQEEGCAAAKPFSRRIRGVTAAGSGGIDPSRKSRSCPSPGRNEKQDLYAVASCTKWPLYVAFPR